MDQMKTVIKPCPVCGNKHVECKGMEGRIRPSYAVYCPVCEFTGPFDWKAAEVAIEEYNRMCAVIKTYLVPKSRLAALRAERTALKEALAIIKPPSQYAELDELKQTLALSKADCKNFGVLLDRVRKERDELKAALDAIREAVAGKGSK